MRVSPAFSVLGKHQYELISMLAPDAENLRRVSPADTIAAYSLSTSSRSSTRVLRSSAYMQRRTDLLPSRKRASGSGGGSVISSLAYSSSPVMCGTILWACSSVMLAGASASRAA